jgi:hypothetical protein
MYRTPLIYLCHQAREDGHKELADRAERMAELLAKCAGELVSLGNNPNDGSSILYQIHSELGYS